MSFENDLFISYAHIDHEPLAPEQQGWIGRFHESPEALLSLRMGGKARIRRDDELRGARSLHRSLIALHRCLPGQLSRGPTRHEHWWLFTILR